MGQSGTELVLPPGLSDIQGCECSRATAATVNVEAGFARSSDGAVTLRVLAQLTADITNVGVPNGLDAGAEAMNTWYAIYVIGDTSGANPVASLLSENFVTPALPAGYDVFRRVGSVRNGTNNDFLDFSQDPGGQVKWVRYRGQDADFALLSGGAAQINTAVDCSPAIPPNAQVAQFQCIQDNAQEANISDVDALTDGRYNYKQNNQYVAEMRVAAGQQIFYANLGANGSFNIGAKAYQDDLTL